MKIVITCALPIEFNEARNQLGLKEITKKGDLPRVAVSGNLHLLCTGIGKTNTTVNLFEYLSKVEPDLVIDSGTCGSLTDKLHPMDIVISREAVEFFSYNFKGHNYLSSLEEIKKVLPSIELDSCLVATIEDSVDIESNKKKLSESGASIVTWETSALFSLCIRLKIPCLSIRGVTDSCNEHTHIDFKKNRVQLCKKLYISIKNMCKGI